MYLECVKCQEKYDYDLARLTCERHSPYYAYLDLKYDQGVLTAARKQKNPYLLLPVSDYYNRMRNTPVVLAHSFLHSKGSSHYLKLETETPTGLGKDRDISLITDLMQQAVLKDAHMVSSGNGAISAAAFAHIHHLHMTCVVPNQIAPDKQAILNFYGAHVKKIPGDYETVFRQVIDHPQAGINITPGIHPVAQEGCKTIAYEIVADINVPDYVIVPCGNGSTLSGIMKGFQDLQDIGLTDHSPHFIGVQIKGAAPLAKAQQLKSDYSVLSKIPDSLAKAILALESYTAPKLLAQGKYMNLSFVEIEEQALRAALTTLAREEFVFADPASAASVAALKYLKIPAGAVVVSVITGSGKSVRPELLEI